MSSVFSPEIDWKLARVNPAFRPKSAGIDSSFAATQTDKQYR